MFRFRLERVAKASELRQNDYFYRFCSILCALIRCSEQESNSEAGDKAGNRARNTSSGNSPFAILTILGDSGRFWTFWSDSVFPGPILVFPQLLVCQALDPVF